MPLFDLSGGAVRAFRRLNSSVDLYESEIEDLFWDNLEAFIGEPLFRIARQARLEGGGIADILCLDPQGRVVIIEIKRDVDRSQLAQCLEYAGWARRTNLDELAKLYARGPDEFFPTWQDFTSTSSPLLLERVPRLFLVARTYHDRTESALEYLSENGVPVTLVRALFYEDTNGNRIVDVDTDRGAEKAPRSAPQPSASEISGRRTFNVTLSDLLDAGLIEVDEPIEWVRRQVGQRYQATITASGEVILDDGRTYPSLSAAADDLSGGSHNGWETWTVPRLGGCRIGSLRSKVMSSS
jgi:hypothetical protein